jgi:hypothetical protein
MATLETLEERGVALEELEKALWRRWEPLKELLQLGKERKKWPLFTGPARRSSRE